MHHDGYGWNHRRPGTVPSGSQLPLELWGEVFKFCCTDDGYTGRSLSLVSRQINELSAPYKYHCIAATSGTRILLLMKTLQQLPPHRRRIHHLFLGDEERLFYEDWEHDSDYEESSSEDIAMETNPDEYDTDDSDALNNASVTDIEIQELKSDVEFFSQPDGKPVLGFDPSDPALGPLPTVHDDVEHFDQALHAAMDKIIVMAQDTLLSLCLYFTAIPFPYTVNFGMPCALPNLVELTLCSSILDHGSFTSSPPPHLTTLFPSLQKLDVNALCDVHAVKQILAIAPHLKCLHAQFDIVTYGGNNWMGRSIFSKTLKDRMRDTGLISKIDFVDEAQVKQDEHFKLVHWDLDKEGMAEVKETWLRRRQEVL